MVNGDNAIVFGQGRAGEALVFRIGVDGQGQISPVDEVVADGVPPVLSRVLRRIGLIEHVPASLPEAEAVGIVEPAFRIDVMVDWSMRLARLSSTRLVHPQQQRIRFELGLLFFKRVGEGVLRDLGGEIGLFVLGR